MICPECGSRVVIYDYKSGDMVCASCGLVLDRVYVYPALKGVEEDTRAWSRARGHPIVKVMRRAKKHREVMKIVCRLREGLALRDDVVRSIVRGEHVKMVKTIVKPAFKNVLESMSLERREVLLNIVKVLNEYPRIASRTDRVKLALAALILEDLKGKGCSISGVARMFMVDPTNLRRAYKCAKRYRRLWDELRRLLSHELCSVVERHGEVQDQGGIKQGIMG